ncbi:Hypothetical protein FKW44_005534 [Caligus rogercresseyi]|uniref:Uncharacterized protein n=1 Tax=Caligus rogercresseyi TaxID=217165 RepID=A0A7T8QS48_CALRO|nr:Hypothetical protein FKW44_005534 [Caligus rogercresseyi]
MVWTRGGMDGKKIPVIFIEVGVRANDQVVYLYLLREEVIPYGIKGVPRQLLWCSNEINSLCHQQIG